MRTLPRLTVAATLILLAAALAGCDSDNGPLNRPPGPVGPIQTVGPTTMVIGPNGTHAVVADRGDLKVADFELASGVTTVVVHSGDLGGGLYRITTPEGAGIVPTAVVSAGHVVVQTASSGVNGPSILDVTLSSAVGWTIHLDGGATSATVDMRNGGLAALDFGAGVSRIDATLPKVNGSLSVRMSGGASEFSVHAPANVPAKVTMAGGGGSATIDGTTHTGIGGGTVFTPDGWDSASQRIDIDNTAGISTFTLDRY